jgi:hypothetical protein
VIWPEQGRYFFAPLDLASFNSQVGQERSGLVCFKECERPAVKRYLESSEQRKRQLRHSDSSVAIKSNFGRETQTPLDDGSEVDPSGKGRDLQAKLNH